MTEQAASRASAPGTAAGVPWEAIVRDTWCMGPTSSGFDAQLLITTERNRWSDAGQPTIYLAGDAGVAIAEFGRHWTADMDLAWLWSLRMRLDRAIDIRRADTARDLGFGELPTWILDHDRCRSTARRLRASGECDGLIVPSAAFLDDDTRWNAVVFVERLGRRLTDAVEVYRSSHVLKRAGEGADAHRADVEQHERG